MGIYIGITIHFISH